MHERFRDEVRPGRSLPPKYEAVLLELEGVFRLHLHERSMLLRELLIASPGFRDRWQRDDSTDSKTFVFKTLDNVTLYKEDPLLWLLRSIADSPALYTLGQLEHNTYFAMLEDHLSTSDTSEAARLDDRLYHRYGEFAAIHELWSLVRLQRPMPAGLDRIAQISDEDVQRLGRPTIFDRRYVRVFDNDLRSSTDDVVGSHLEKVTAAIDRHLTQPKFTNKMRIEQFKDIRARMKEFWKAMRDHRRLLYQRTEQFHPDAFISVSVIIHDVFPKFRV